LRCFIALGLVPPPGPELADALERLRGFAELSVPPPGNLHITLAFMGDLPDTALTGAGEAMRSAAASAGGRWTVEWGATGAFPDGGRPRVVWLGLADPALTTTVQGLLLAELRARGLPADERTFRPHLTLARVRSAMPRERAASLARALGEVPRPPAATVEALVLYRSTPGPRGSIYEDLASAPL
jgi:2'-5' RNA ligase